MPHLVREIRKKASDGSFYWQLLFAISTKTSDGGIWWRSEDGEIKQATPHEWRYKTVPGPETIPEAEYLAFSPFIKT